MGLPKSPGVYIVQSGDCVSHIGSTGTLAARVYTLASLGTHRASAKVLCAAYCTGEAPLVWWQLSESAAAAAAREKSLKMEFGEPPLPGSEYASCVSGARLLSAVLKAAGDESWHAGYAEATFRIGEKLSLLFTERFEPIWNEIGKPPGPWNPAKGRVTDA
jgi:hypothetical protein